LDASNINLGVSELKEGKRPVAPPSEISVKAGALLFKEGDSSREVYIVKHGTLSVSQRRGSQQVELAQLQERAVLGEMSLLDNQPRSATVRAISDVRLTVIAPATFQAMLHMVPAWLLAVLKIVTHRLRETNSKIHQHTVPEPMESLSVFLVEKCKAYANKNRSTPSFPWFNLIDEFCLLTRLKREDVQKLVQILNARSICSVSSQQELIVPDPDLLIILRDWLSCQRRKQSYPFANIDPLVKLCSEVLPKIPSEALSSSETLLEYLQKNVDSRVVPSLILKLSELGLLLMDQQEHFSVVTSQIEFMQKALVELDRVTDHKDKSR